MHAENFWLDEHEHYSVLMWDKFGKLIKSTKLNEQNVRKWSHCIGRNYSTYHGRSYWGIKQIEYDTIVTDLQRQANLV